MQTQSGVGNVPPKTKALTATIVSVFLTLLILNVVCGWLLDRKQHQDDAPLQSFIKGLREMWSDKAFRSTVIKGAFFVCLAMSNILALKLCRVGILEFNAGAIPYALTFMLVETVAETQNRTSARKLWLAGILTYLVVIALVYLAVHLPAGNNREFQDILLGTLKTDSVEINKSAEASVNYVKVFNELFKKGPLVFLAASFCSFAVAQYLDIGLFMLIRRVTKKRALWLRSNLSTFVAQMVDTIIFIVIAYLILRSDWYEMQNHIVGQLGVKWVFAIVYTPLLYGAVLWIEHGRVSHRIEGFPKLLKRLRRQGRRRGHNRVHRVHYSLKSNKRRKGKRQLPTRIPSPLAVSQDDE